MYNWIETTLNVSGGVSQAIAVILALAVVLLLFALFIFILKRLTGNQSTQNRNRQPRIAVMDSATIDTKRRLVLIRRDNIEHLILVGGPSDVVVEQNIVRNMPLPQARSGQHPSSGMGSGIGSSIGSGIGGPASIRSPMAPGPDIPARPDDTVAQNEPAPPPPAMQARQPSPSAPPAPDTPAPAPEAPPKTVSAPPAAAPRSAAVLPPPRTALTAQRAEHR
jgi:flagellar biogenesis protein FliO